MNVVVTAWRVPDFRIAEFVEWNRDNFATIGARCAIVTDRALDLPDGFDYVIYDKPMEIFNLSACSNFGLKYFSAGVICKTDIDCYFSSSTLADMAALEPGFAIAPIYVMATDTQGANGNPWEASVGTITMHWCDWLRVGGYNERMQGYGVEDGDLYCRARDAGVTIGRGHTVIHVAHDGKIWTNSPRKRTDCWGRADGFNPRNHRANRRARGAWGAKDFLEK